MGVSDAEELFEIKNVIDIIKKQNNLKFQVKVDLGDYETALVFNHETGNHRFALRTETWDCVLYPEEMKCPDILIYDLKLIIEYEENGCKKRPGARIATKGHGFSGDHSNKRDSNRNKLYKKDFILFQIWENEPDYKDKLEQIITQLSKKTQ